MSGLLLRQDVVSGISVTTVKDLTQHTGGFAAATWFLDVSAITGTWDITLRWKAETNKINVAVLSGITTPGLKRLGLTSDFNAARHAIPVPVEVEYTMTVGGSLSAVLYGLLGD